jgi:hypothetical protein
MFVDRASNPNLSNNFNFKIIKSLNFNIFIGVQIQGVERQEWWMRLKDCALFKSRDGLKAEYVSVTFKEGDIVSLQLVKEQLIFYLNNESLGVAFEEPLFKRYKCCPFVFLGERIDHLDILSGCTDPINSRD